MNDNENDVERFFNHDSKHDDPQEAKSAKPKKTKKRKPEGGDVSGEQQESDNSLKRKARFYCSCPEQWRAVSRYTPQKMSEFVAEKEFQQNKDLSTTVFNGIHKGMAGLLDMVSNGEGHVEEQILADVTLRQSIEEEGASLIFLIQNKVRIIVLSVLDVYHGKRIQRKLRGPGPTIEEEVPSSNFEPGQQAPEEVNQTPEAGVNYR